MLDTNFSDPKVFKSALLESKIEAEGYYQNLKSSKSYKDFQTLEALTPHYIEAKISVALNSISRENLESLNLQEILGVQGDGIDKLQKKLKSEIKKELDANSNLSPSDAFEKIKQTTWWQQILEFLGLSVKIESQLQNISPKTIQKVLKARKSELMKKIDDFEKVEKKVDIAQSAHVVNEMQTKNGKTVFIKGVDLESIKAGFTRNIIGVRNEGIREYFGAEFMREMGIQNTPKIELIPDERGKVTRIVSHKVGDDGDAVTELGKKLGAPEGTKHMTSEEKAGVQKQATQLFAENEELKEKIMEFHAISFLMGNRDLHLNNIMIIEGKDRKLSCAPIDFGLSGHNFNSTITSAFVASLTRFDTSSLKHSDANLLFTDAEYKPVLERVVKEYEKKAEKIQDKIFYDCKALGASDAEVQTLKASIAGNVALAKSTLSPSKSSEQSQSC